MQKKFDKASDNNRLLRWSLWFDNYDVKFEHVLDIKNSIANFLTREYQMNIVQPWQTDWSVISSLLELHNDDSRNSSFL